MGSVSESLNSQELKLAWSSFPVILKSHLQHSSFNNGSLSPIIITKGKNVPHKAIPFPFYTLCTVSPPFFHRHLFSVRSSCRRQGNPFLPTVDFFLLFMPSNTANGLMKDCRQLLCSGPNGSCFMYEAHGLQRFYEESLSEFTCPMI